MGRVARRKGRHRREGNPGQFQLHECVGELFRICLLYTSDAADERSSVDLGGRRIIKKKNSVEAEGACHHTRKYDARE